MKKLLFVWEHLKGTFWFTPAIIILFTIAVAIGLLYLDSVISLPAEGVIINFFLVDNPDSARNILSIISGAMIGVTGTVFSATLVALTLASSQFGPRLIRNFMYVRINQVVLGSYVSTFLYCLIVLNTIRDYDDYTFVPSISILAAIVGAIINIILLIVFIHQIAVSIQADSIISDISDVISTQIKSTFPCQEEGLVNQDNVDEYDFKPSYSKAILVRLPVRGYIQYIDEEKLLELAVKHEALIELKCRSGQFLVEGAIIGTIFYNGQLKKKDELKIQHCLVMGKTKTSQNNLEHSIEQMVEIAARALSPGINDPFTAIACIDNLSATLCQLAKMVFPHKYQLDDNDQLRIIFNRLNFETILDTSFNQIRQYAKGNEAVITKIMESLATISTHVKTTSDRNAVVKHTKMLLRLVESSVEEENIANKIKETSKIILN